MNGSAPLLLAAAACVAGPLFGVAAIRLRGEERNPRWPAVGGVAVALAAAGTLAWLWHAGSGRPVAYGPSLAGGSLVFVDGLTALLLPFVAAVQLAIVLMAPRRALSREAVTRLLVGAALTTALLATAHPVALVGLWAATLLPTWLSTRATPGGGPTARVYAIAMTLGLVCVASGTTLLVVDPPWLPGGGGVGVAGGWLVAVAVMIRKGIVPFHSWYPALFAGAPMSTALAATMPQVGSYTAVRLLVGHADGVPTELVALSIAAVVTAVYGAALAVVQRDARGLVGMLAMSQSAMVLAGLAGTLPMELCGALAVWVSSGLALTGIGLVIWALESRAGPIAIDTLQGRFADAPALAAFLLLFGLASLGFPGTLSFVADDLIISGSLDERLFSGLLVLVATVFAGIAVIRGWFRIFGGAVTVDATRHAILRRERIALSAVLAILVGLGLCPGPFVRSLDRIAGTLLAARTAADDPAAGPGLAPDVDLESDSGTHRGTDP
jgi:NADH-quinone oxidoreductase subunit M